MNSGTGFQALKVNKKDPRQSPEFLEINWSMQNADIRRMSESEWKTLDSQCRAYWRKYGYDLQSGCWFCLMSLKLDGWRGLAQGLNILVRVWRGKASEYCWPPVVDSDRRRYLLEWLNTHVVTSIYQLDCDDNFTAVASSIAESIALLYDEAVKTDARCRNSLKNMHYFLQVRSKASSSLILSLAHLKIDKDIRPELSPINIKANSSVQGSSIKIKHLIQAGCAGIIGGMLATMLLMSGIRYMEKPGVTEKLAGVLQDFPGDDALTALAWQGIDKEELESHRDEILHKSASLLTWIADRPNDELLRKGDILAQRLENAWPDNSVSQKWKYELQAKANILPSTWNYKEVTADLDEFDLKLANAEQKKGGYLTISELKSFSWKIRRKLESSGVPPEELLRYSAEDKEGSRKEILESVAKTLSALNALYVLSVNQNDKPAQENH
ncbi:hypothetical protein F385_3396 [Pantoea agglomerans 299R]|nr:VasL domain-containing protein [Pantoea agglomerans]ELP23671.1 hypothetical protein F385_3396 [Pantoea agglomerans 299R]